MKKVLVFLIGVLALVALSASASTFKVGEIYEHKAGSIFDDIYIAGGSVDVTGDVIGDGVVVGGEISILGNISQDITAAGGSIDIIGVIGDDVRVAGGNISVSSRIGDDLVAFGGLVKVLSESTIAGDAVLVGGTILMNGTVSGDLKVFGGDVTINGPIKGDVIIRFAKKITLGEDAVITGRFTYSAPEELQIPEGVVIGGEVTRIESPFTKFEKKDVRNIFGFLIFGKFLILLVTSVLAVIVFKRFSSMVGGMAYTNFWKNALIGFISLIVVPVAAIILLATILGSYIGFLLFSAYMLMLLVAKVFAGIVVGALLSKWIKKEVIVNWKWAALGVTLLQILILIPILGTLIAFIVGMASFGTVLVLLYRKMWLSR